MSITKEELMFGRESIVIEKTSAEEKIATFKNVGIGEVIQHPFNQAFINPNSDLLK